MIFATTIGTPTTLAVVDTGASGGFETRGHLVSENIPIGHSAVSPNKGAGGRLSGILGEKKVPFRMGPYSSVRKMFVVESTGRSHVVTRHPMAKGCRRDCTPSNFADTNQGHTNHSLLASKKQAESRKAGRPPDLHEEGGS